MRECGHGPGRVAAVVMIAGSLGACVQRIVALDESGSTTESAATTMRPDASIGADDTGTTASSLPPPIDATTDGDGETSTSSTTANDDTDDGLTFITVPDGGCLQYRCDLLAQDCPPSETCVPVANDGGPTWNGTRCAPIPDDPGVADDPCTASSSGCGANDTCGAALVCWGSVEDGTGVCKPLCLPGSQRPVCDDGQFCALFGAGGSVPLCMTQCDPLVQDCALAGQACYPLADGWACVPDRSGTSGAYGDPCDALDECDPGLACIGAPIFTDCDARRAFGCCTIVCDASDEASDAACASLHADHACTPFSGDPQFEHLGVCAIP